MAQAQLHLSGNSCGHTQPDNGPSAVAESNGTKRRIFIVGSMDQLAAGERAQIPLHSAVRVLEKYDELLISESATAVTAQWHAGAGRKACLRAAVARKLGNQNWPHSADTYANLIKS